jgi:hypothetical protein
MVASPCYSIIGCRLTARPGDTPGFGLATDQQLSRGVFLDCNTYFRMRLDGLFAAPSPYRPWPRSAQAFFWSV